MEKTFKKIHPVQVKESSGELVDFLHPDLDTFPQYEGTVSVCLQQDVVSHYGNSTGSGALSALFAKRYDTNYATDYTETRSMLFRVPSELPDEKGEMRPIEFKDVEMILETIPNARIVKTLSSEPIITEALQYSISQGNNTLEAIAEKQAIRDDEGNIIINKKTGKPVYRLLEFSVDYNEKDDVDLQVEIPVEQHITA